MLAVANLELTGALPVAATAVAILAVAILLSRQRRGSSGEATAPGLANLKPIPVPYPFWRCACAICVVAGGRRTTCAGTAVHFGALRRRHFPLQLLAPVHHAAATWRWM